MTLTSVDFGKRPFLKLTRSHLAGLGLNMNELVAAQFRHSQRYFWSALLFDCFEILNPPGFKDEPMVRECSTSSPGICWSVESLNHVAAINRRHADPLMQPVVARLRRL
jgi:hypothetical protein